MKRIFGLIILLAVVMGTVLTGCEKAPDTTPAAGTNAPSAPEMPASTNK
jgi:hypothetical protein